jgi:hypothetical protein
VLVVNLFAGPGAGKSTTAALLFALLKLGGYSVELVTEFAKDLTWDESHKPLGYQPYVFAQQAWRLERLRGKVDIAVTDSPLLMSLAYTPIPIMVSGFADYVKWEARRDAALNILLHRVKPYVRVGRSQTESEARALDDRIKTILLKTDTDFYMTPGDSDAPHTILAHVIRRLGIPNNG